MIQGEVQATRGPCAIFLSASSRAGTICRIFRVLGIITDNASNITGAVDALACEGGVRCFAHTLQLSVQKGPKLSDVKEVLDKASSVVLYFRHLEIRWWILFVSPCLHVFRVCYLSFHEFGSVVLEV